MTFWPAFFSALAMVLWLGTILACIAGATEFSDGRPWLAVAFCIAGLFLFAAGIAFIATAPNQQGRCLRGHEQWLMVGKIMQKQWVCDEQALE